MVDVVIDVGADRRWDAFVAGLPAAVRAVICLQHSGYERITLVGEGADRALGQLARHPYFRVDVQIAEAVPQVTGTPRLVFRTPVAFPSATAKALASLATSDGFVVEPGAIDGLPDFLIDARDRAGRADAAQRIRHASRKPVRNSGLAAVAVLMPICQLLARLIHRTPLSPNTITVLGFLMGLGSLPLVATGDYTAVVIGFALLFGHALFDVLDGVIARTKFWFTSIGERLDQITNDIIKAVVLAPVGMGLHNATGDSRWELLGWLGAGARVLYAATIQYYVWRKQHSGYATNFRFWYNVPRDGAQRRATPQTWYRKYIQGRMKYFLRVDFIFTAFLVCSIFDFVEAPFLLAALGAIEYGILAVVQLVLFHDRVAFEHSHLGDV